MNWLTLKFFDSVICFTKPDGDWIASILSQLPDFSINVRKFDQRTDCVEIGFDDGFLHLDFKLVQRALFWSKADIYLGD